jgi:cytochrome c553
MSSCFQNIKFFLKAWAFFIFAIQVNAEQTIPHIQTLAASCGACHGAKGNSLGGTPVLAGLNKQYFVNQMIAFRKNERDSTVMHRHAKGLNLDEINQLAVYFFEQKRTPSMMPQTQKMDSNRDY